MIDGPLELRVSLDVGEATARHARRLVSDWLQGVECSEPIKQDAVLAVSELVTNAVVHAGSASTLAAAFDDGRLRIEVADRDPTHMPRRVESPGPGGGYGMRIIEEISDAWGCAQSPDGKHIWLEILC